MMIIKNYINKNAEHLSKVDYDFKKTFVNDLRGPLQPNTNHRSFCHEEEEEYDDEKTSCPVCDFHPHNMSLRGSAQLLQHLVTA